MAAQGADAPQAVDLRRGHMPARRLSGAAPSAATHVDPTSGGAWMGLAGLVDGLSGLHQQARWNFFVFLLINRGGQTIALVVHVLTVTFRPRRLCCSPQLIQTPASRNIRAVVSKFFQMTYRMLT